MADALMEFETLNPEQIERHHGRRAAHELRMRCLLIAGTSGEQDAAQSPVTPKVARPKP